MKSTKELWTEMHTNSKFRPKYPSEVIVQYVFRNFDRDGNTKILDLGCGAGRHVAFMAREGIVPYGIDFSLEGVNYTKQMLRELGGGEKYADNIYEGSSVRLPFEDNFFDGIISYGVLYYMNSNDIRHSVNEIHRVLKPGGKSMICVRSTKDYRCSLQGNKPAGELNTYYIDESDNEKCASNENGMLMHFFEREELKNLFSAFSDIKIDTIEESHDNGQFYDSNFVVSVIK